METQRTCAAAFQQGAVELEKLALQSAAHRRKFQLAASQFSQFVTHFSEIATDSPLNTLQFKANSGIIKIITALSEMYRQSLLQNWAHTVMSNATAALAGELAAHITGLNEHAHVFDAQGAEFLDPSSPKWLQFHILDVKTIFGSLEHHLAAKEAGPTTTSAIQKRLKSIQRFLDEFQDEDPIPGGRYFSPIPVHYQNWRLTHADLECKSEEGKGVSAVVYYGHDKRTGAEVAIKEFKWDKLKGSRLKSFEREVVVLATLDHPTLLKFVGAVDSPPFCIVTEWMGGGTLYHDLHKQHRLDPTQLTIAMIDVARGLNFLHSRSVIHRDMKSLNVLLTSDGFARICDFGFSRAISSHDQLMTNNIGTPHWMAPELLTGNGIYDEKVDVYAYGIVLWEVLTRMLPYGTMKPAQIITQVAMQDIRPAMPRATPKLIQDLICNCWVRDPDGRPSFRQILTRLIAGEFMLPGADTGRVEAHVRARVDKSEYAADGEDSQLIPTLNGIERQMSKGPVSPELAERCWASLQAIDRGLNKAMYMKCLALFLPTSRDIEVTELLRCEPNRAVPYEVAAKIAEMIPTGKDGLDLNLVVIACKNGAAAEAVVHSYQLSHLKLALEIVARTGIKNDELREPVVTRCLTSLKANDSLLIVAAFRCLIAIGEAKAIPIELIKSSVLSRNATVKLVAYLAAAKMADEGVELPEDFLDSCIEKIGDVGLAAHVLVSAAGNPGNARYLVLKLARFWIPSSALKIRILFRATQITELATMVRVVAERMQIPESETKEREALLVLRQRCKPSG
jgi:hypothetical protein